MAIYFCFFFLNRWCHTALVARHLYLILKPVRNIGFVIWNLCLPFIFGCGLFNCYYVHFICTFCSVIDGHGQPVNLVNCRIWRLLHLNYHLGFKDWLLWPFFLLFVQSWFLRISAISNFPGVTQDVPDPEIMLAFPIIGDPHNAAFVAWTTTPWTLPSNLALCVNANFVYVKVSLVCFVNLYVGFCDKLFTQLYWAL